MERFLATDTEAACAARVRGGSPPGRFCARERRAPPHAIRHQPPGPCAGDAFRSCTVRARPQASHSDARRRAPVGCSLAGIQHNSCGLHGARPAGTEARPERPLYAELRCEVARAAPAGLHDTTPGCKHPAVLERRAAGPLAPRANRRRRRLRHRSEEFRAHDAISWAGRDCCPLLT